MSQRQDRSVSLAIQDIPVYHVSKDQLEMYLQTSVKQGLGDNRITELREEFGTNEIKPPKKKNLFLMLLAHLFNSITFILYAVFILTMVNAEYIDSCVVMVIILLNAAIGYMQELKSVRSLEALEKASHQSAMVRRNGGTMEIDVNEVVVGDIILLKQGDSIPADGRLISTNNLEVDEALLTGEGVPVYKGVEPLPVPQKVNGLDVRVAIGDRTNMVFRQTNVVGGSGVAIVTAVGYDTKVGQLSKRLQSGNDEKTPQQKRLEKFMFILFAIAILLALSIFAITEFNFRKEEVIYASATGIALLPEALIAVVTVSLALAVTRLAEKHSIVRKISAVEVLGTVTNICSDKTGTLTEGKMTVKRVWPYKSKFVYHVTGGAMDATCGFGVEVDPTDQENIASLEQQAKTVRSMSRGIRPSSVASPRSLSNATETRSARAPTFAHNVMRVVQGVNDAEYSVVQKACNELGMVASMCNNTQLQYDDENDKLVGSGNPTELALQVFAYKVGLDPQYFEQTEGWRQCGQWAFDSTVKCMSVGLMREVLKETDEEEGKDDGNSTKECIVLTKGAPEAILPKCLNIDIPEIMVKVNHLAAQGFRVLACGMGTHMQFDDVDGKRIHDFERHHVESNLRFLGLFCVYDPPKESSFRAVAACREAGITFHMVTGDHHKTAENISRTLKILDETDEADRITTGPVFDAMSEAQIDAMPELPLVIARCSPESKVKLVEALHRRNRVVAMTGDGINDAPAIKVADVGAAMGISGTDVTKAVADLVIANDDISTLVTAVELGRGITDSIKAFIVHLLSSNIAEVLCLILLLILRDDNDHVIFPLTPLEILLVNTLTSSPPAIALTLEPIDPDVMKRQPNDGNFFTKEVVIDQAVYGIGMGAILIGSYLYVIFGAGDGTLGFNCNNSDGINSCLLVWEARTTTFAVLNELLLVQGYVCRSRTKSIFAFNFFSNMALVGSAFVGSLLLIPCIYIPWAAEKLFKHAQITWEWLVVLVAIIVYILYTEIYKYIKRSLAAHSEGHRRSVTLADGGKIELIEM